MSSPVIVTEPSPLAARIDPVWRDRNTWLAEKRMSRRSSVADSKCTPSDEKESAWTDADGMWPGTTSGTYSTPPIDTDADLLRPSDRSSCPPTQACAHSRSPTSAPTNTSPRTRIAIRNLRISVGVRSGHDPQRVALQRHRKAVAGPQVVPVDLERERGPALDGDERGVVDVVHVLALHVLARAEQLHDEAERRAPGQPPCGQHVEPALERGLRRDLDPPPLVIGVRVAPPDQNDDGRNQVPVVHAHRKVRVASPVVEQGGTQNSRQGRPFVRFLGGSPGLVHAGHRQRVE